MSGSNNLSIPQMDDSTAGKSSFLNDMLALVDQSITAALAIDASANTALTSQAIVNYAKLVADNVPAGGTTVTLGPVKRVYILANDKASAGVVTFACGTSSVAVAAGKLALVYMDGTTNGLAVVSSASASALAALSDVDVPNAPTNGYVLTWNASESKWNASAPTGGSGGGSGGGSSTAQVSARYWRIAELDSISGQYVGTGELQFFNQAGVLIPSSNPFSNGDDTDPIAHVNDGDLTTFWTTEVYRGNPYVGLDLGAGATPYTFLISARNQLENCNIISCVLEYSADKEVWTRLAAYIVPAWAKTDSETKTLPIPAGVVASSGGGGSGQAVTYAAPPAAKAWRLLFTDTDEYNTPAGGGQCTVGDIDFLDAGGNSLLGGGVPLGWNSNNSFPTANAFDGNQATLWSTGNPVNPNLETALGYLWPTAQTVKSVRIKGAPGYSSHSPHDFSIQNSPDGRDWTTVAEITGAAVWADSEVRNYPVNVVPIATGSGGSSLEKPFVVPPAVATFTNQNPDPTYTHAVDLAQPAAGAMLYEDSHNYGNSNQLRALLMATPAAHWQLTMRLRRHSPLVNYSGWGFVMRDSAGGKSMIMGQTAADNGWGELQLSSDTSYSGDGGLGGFKGGDYQYDFWLRAVNDGTNFRLYMSRDGYHWAQLTYYNDSTVNGFFGTAPDHVGFGYSPNNADNGLVAADVTCFSWELAALA